MVTKSFPQEVLDVALNPGSYYVPVKIGWKEWGQAGAHRPPPPPEIRADLIPVTVWVRHFI